MPGKTCKALFDFAARKPEELSLTKGETLTNVGKVSDEWWKGRNSDGKVGVFPSNYVVVIDLDNVKKWVVARYDFDATKSDRISFKKGDKIAVLAEVSAEWWTGRNPQGETGLFPSNYVAEEKGSGKVKSKPAAVSRKSSSATFTSATLKDFPIQFKMPSTSMPSLKIGADEDSKAKQARSGVKSKLQEMNALLAK
mmetsp:Transcript_8513/g.14698  ORF Transcript_8513/g.14698 Transcript_8513/m.14698 type:complete len:196 (+) Transcript_8513:16-603(+)